MTTDPTIAVVDYAAAAIDRTLVILAPVDRVWETITQPDLIAEWFGDSATIDALEPGAGGSITWDDRGTCAILVDEVDEPSVFAFRWGPSDLAVTAQNSTLVRFTLEEMRGGTQLSVVETGFADAYPDHEVMTAELDEHASGWNSRLDELAELLEKQDSQ
ncbi:SRPBCC domain-containing protein [Marisediminicola senii]|uniref:SRPBCC domain-containing protein n=1 Tax=Marisediminicola senii TaxID=2711233 RepID=UPI0013EA7471|nr:SRPBCC domain-containing protein [Marisediminicola senii]